MFKKVMEVPDSLIIKYFELATDEHPDTIEKIKGDLDNGKNPRDVKLELARIITKLYHGDEELREAEKFYIEAFSKKAIPTDIPEIIIKEGKTLLDIGNILVKGKFVASNKELRRLVEQGGVQLNMEKVKSANVVLQENDVLKIGKKRFVKIKI